MSYQTLETLEQRRRVIRIVLFLIILSTMPFYCAGFLLWGTSQPASFGAGTPLASSTPIGGNLTPTQTVATVTRLPLTVTSSSPLQPTPLQFNPIRPPGGGVAPTQPFVVPPTVFIPPATLAPTLTPFPTNPPPATFTPLPTEPPLPTVAPLPTNTTVPPTVAPPPTDPPTIEPLPPTAEPLPFDPPAEPAP
jgi:hypothetical protein